MGLTVFHNCQRSGSGKWAQGVSAYPAPEGDGCTIGMLSRKKWGSLGGKGPMEPGRPSGRRSIRARPPERVFGYFLHEQKVPRRKAKPCTPFLLAHTKEMVFGEYIPKAQPLDERSQGRQPLDHIQNFHIFVGPPVEGCGSLFVHSSACGCCGDPVDVLLRRQSLWFQGMRKFSTASAPPTTIY